MEGRRRSSETRRLTFDSTHRKYSVESASAWMPSAPRHLPVSVFCVHDLGDRAVCHRERRGAPPSSFLQTTESASRANCSSPLPKNIKTDLYIYTALYTLFVFFFYHCKSQKYRKIKCFIITGHFSFSLCLFFRPGKKVVPGGNWLTPSVKFVAGLKPLPRRHFVRLPVFPRQPQ